MIHCDIFCRVVDNFGDIGVAWRLARQLGEEQGWQVRLMVDDLKSFVAIAPGVDAGKHQQQCGSSGIYAWNTAPNPESVDLVIEAFACELPAEYVEAMGRMTPPPQWLNLEYLSAEPWVEQHHLLPSPHPRLPLTKHFFFPGFSAGTGGLIRERHVVMPAVANTSPQSAYVFAYDTLAAQEITTQLVAHHIEVSVAHGALGLSLTKAENKAGRAPNRIKPMAFVPQPAFDQVLAQHDVLIVRGEDSFVRAQYAARPFLWHIYPQADGAHLVKLEAFLDRYCEGLAPDAADVHRALHRVLADGVEADAEHVAALVSRWLHHFPVLHQHARGWAAHLLAAPDLVSNLVAWLELKRKNP